MRKFFYALLTLVLIGVAVGLGVYAMRLKPVVAPRVPLTAKLPQPTTEQWNLSMQLQQNHQALVDPDRKQILVDPVYWDGLTDYQKKEVANNLLHVAVSMDSGHQCYDIADMKSGRVLAMWRAGRTTPELELK